MREWRECARQTLGKRWFNAWTDDHYAADDPLLVEQIRRRILPRRGIMASEDEILVTLGAQHALYMISSLLAKPTTKVAVEEPGLPDARNIFSLHTRDVCLCDVDGQGLSRDAIPAGTEMAFVTPSHQAPTTVTMPLSRRLELMEAARKRDFILIEDDHEFETNYVNEPCPSLKSLDDDGHVIYVGSLSKSVFHGLRVGPCSTGSVTPMMPNSGVLVLPTMSSPLTPPACQRQATQPCLRRGHRLLQSLRGRPAPRRLHRQTPGHRLQGC